MYLWAAGADGQCYYVSPTIESILGYRRVRWLADPQLWANRLHPEDRDRVVAEELRCRERGEDLACEYRMLARDGRFVWIRDEAVMIRNEGSPHHLQGLMYDVSAEKEAQASLRRSREETIRRLSRAAEFRDDETGAHIERMSRYCELIAERLGLDPEFCEHCGSPARCTTSARSASQTRSCSGPLRSTPRSGLRCSAMSRSGTASSPARAAELLDLAATIAWTHHERFDGGGYPRGLEGEAIPLSGRIAAVADVFDALTHDRVYGYAYSYDRAVRMMRAERGSHFDPRVLDAFLTGEVEIKAILESCRSATG